MTKDELVDHAVGKCDPVDTGEWGRCQTHSVGWAPAAFHTGRCWAVERQITAIDTVLADLRAKVEALPQATVCGVLYAIDDVVSRADVLALFDGSSDE